MWLKSKDHKSPKNNNTTTLQTNKAEATHNPIERLINFIRRHKFFNSFSDCSRKSGFLIVKTRRSMMRALSTIRPKRPDITFKNPAMPVSIKIGATTICMTWARSFTDVAIVSYILLYLFNGLSFVLIDFLSLTFIIIHFYGPQIIFVAMNDLCPDDITRLYIKFIS